MFILDNFYWMKGSLKFMNKHIDLIERSVERADIIFDSWFTTCWIEMENE